MTRRRGLLVALTMGIVACGVPADPDPVVTDDDRVPFALLDPAPPTPPPDPDGDPGRTAALCLRRDDHLVTVRRSLPGAAADLEALLRSEPTRSERAAGLRSAIFADDVIVDVEVAAGTARVALGEGFTTAALEDELFALAQVVCTLTGQPGIGQVAFSLGGAPVDVPTGDGSLSSVPVSRDDYRNLLR